MPPQKKTQPSSTGFALWWRRWERLTRHGIRVQNRRYSSAFLLQTWAAVLMLLYLIIWIGGRSETRLDRLSDEQFFRGRHLIFTVSGGRSGSKYLSEVLGVGEGVLGLHEPEPKMNGDVLKQVLLDGRRQETFEERTFDKVEAIRDVLEGMDNDVVYAETSHMFVKTFWDIILYTLGDIAQITIVFLKRPLRDVVLSQARLGWFATDHSGKDVWYYDPANVHSSQQVWESFNATDQLGLLLAYNIDVIKRGDGIKQLVRKQHEVGYWKHVKIKEVSLDEISGTKIERGVSRVLHRIGLEVDDEKLKLLTRMDRNDRDEKKERVLSHWTMDEVETRMEKLKREVPDTAEILG